MSTRRPTSSADRDRVSLGRGVAWFGFLAIVTAGLVAYAAASRSQERRPPLDASGWPDWIEAAGPGAALMSVGWLAVATVVAYLWVVSTAVIAARHRGVSNTIVDAVTPTIVKSILTGTATLGLVGAVPAAAISPYVVHQSGGGANPTPSAEFGPTDRASAPVMTTADPETTTAERADPPIMTQSPNAEGTTRAPEVGSEAPVMTEVAESADWTVAPGDHLWSIAEQITASALDRHPTEAEVSRYWLQLIEVNKANLIDPTNPDLIRPGQTLMLPAGP